MEDWVLVDTVIRASFFSKPDSPEKRAVDDLIDADRVALIGPIVAEVLLGFRRKAQADWVASRLRAAHFLEATWDDWKSAAEIGRALAANGHTRFPSPI
jgi:predicted nucleic acid-binding protein